MQDYQNFFFIYLGSWDYASIVIYSININS
jgi:hypothetical protein